MKEKQNKTNRLAIYLTEDEYQEFEQLAQAYGVSMSPMVRMIVKREIESKKRQLPLKGI